MDQQLITVSSKDYILVKVPVKGWYNGKIFDIKTAGKLKKQSKMKIYEYNIIKGYHKDMYYIEATETNRYMSYPIGKDPQHIKEIHTTVYKDMLRETLWFVSVEQAREHINIRESIGLNCYH